MIQGLFREPVGIDFSASFAAGLRARLTGQPPEAMARVTVLVNTTRMARRIEAALVADGATLLPRIGLVTDLAPLLPPGDAAVADIEPLALRLKLTQLVAQLLEAAPDLAPASAAFDLASSLTVLLAEMQEEGMDPAALADIDTGDLSMHWQNTLRFLTIATDWMATDGTLTPAGAQALTLDRLLDHWRSAAPQDPIIIAGSTASRAPTRALIRATLDLPQGAVVLPGVDTDMPESAWAGLTDADGPGQQDHPQYRHAALMRDLGLTRDGVARWGDAVPAAPGRNALVSLALRPAPVTDAWRDEGPALDGIDAACAGVTLLAAPSPGAEAAAIATGLRAALEAGRTAALITPDRTLSRQVAAHLDRWGIVPDDSAGKPLNQSAIGRLLLHTADMRGQTVEAEPLAILLKHPLTQAGGDRQTHLKRARALELGLLRAGPCPFPTRAAMDAWMAKKDPPQGPDGWSRWLADLLDALPAQPGTAPLVAHVDTHLALIDRIVGTAGDGTDPAWSDPAGRAARQVIDRLMRAAPARGDVDISARDYARILSALLQAEEVRDPYSPHPGVMIWGALEARVRTADLVILGGLNDDVWPGQPTPDPWLNRAMRHAVGLRLPDRSIGLSAHDFQQAAAGPEIWLSRAARSAEAETVPSRWLNRLQNLLGGIGQGGQDALAAMKARGDGWLSLAAALDAPVAKPGPAPRPAPILPPDLKLDRLSVTGVETLIRDPYAIYARHFLRLEPLDPLRQGPDARVRGSAVHDAMERFSRDLPDDLPPDAAGRLRSALAVTLEETAPWPGARRLWLGKFERVTDQFIADEIQRRTKGRPQHAEAKGELRFDAPPFTLTARADRIDDRGDAVALYDYKTGTPPSGPAQLYYAKQLLLMAVMVEAGAFAQVSQRNVAEVAYIQVGTQTQEVAPKDFDAELVAKTRADLLTLIEGYQSGTPFIARLAPDFLSFTSAYDQLSRFGEWDDTNAARPIHVGQP
ncbi:double-strand break repair protein AddB [Jannaschia donghaensis]|uniref:Double-strand break repair protein AddB n=1 Tax=Jannaschia donghaensis TaxID=420998 RepID=A0A0M6YEW9_9RHOB|nr:double-strand break repair protein AddB [Jannaschia donghaensis]CTQ48902.1 double-strand break repair protein AddB [Jannaschia donghaensis]